MTHFNLRSSLFAAAMILFSIAAQAQVGIRTATPGSTLDIRGSFAGNYTRVTTTPFTMNDTSFYAVYAGTANGTINLPAAISGTGNFLGRMYYFKNTTAAYSLTIDAAGTETIDDSLTLTIPAGYGAIIVNTGLTGATAATWEVVSFGATTTTAIASSTNGNPQYANCLGMNTAVVPVTSVTGRVWMDRNLGATRRAISYDDPQAQGCLYQWGRGNDGHASITNTGIFEETHLSNFLPTSFPANPTVSGSSSTDDPGNNGIWINPTAASLDWRVPQNNSLWQGVNGINNPCPAGYRIATQAEWMAEKTAYGITSPQTGYNSILKLTAGYFRLPTGLYNAYGTRAAMDGGYWNSLASGPNAGVLKESVPYLFGGDSRGAGYSVRCIMN